MVRMRKLALAALLVAVGLLAASAASGGRATRSVPDRISIRVPASWHPLQGWLSDVTDPAPRLAIASFPARLSRQTCACGLPNVIHFPRDGAFVFVWEYLHPSRRMLAALRPRPLHLRLRAAEPQRFTCHGPSDSFNFKAHGRDFQVEVYLGPAANPVTRTQMLAILDSFRAGPNA
jgi:hypothetical protein